MMAIILHCAVHEPVIGDQMSNHAYATCSAVPSKQFWKIFCHGLTITASERFDGAASVSRDQDTVAVSLVNDATGETLTEVRYWLNDEGQIEWSHHFGQLHWWFQETLASKTCRYCEQELNAGVIITDDGIEEEMRPEFDLRYPRLCDWENWPITALQGSGMIGKLSASVLQFADRLCCSDPLKAMRRVLDRE
jgi:hypothetical protein